jgi:hypothetical protein
MPLQCIYCNVVIYFLIYFFSIKWIIANWGFVYCCNILLFTIINILRNKQSKLIFHEKWNWTDNWQLIRVVSKEMALSRRCYFGQIVGSICSSIASAKSTGSLHHLIINVNTFFDISVYSIWIK